MVTRFPTRRDESGFTLLAVVLLVSVISTISVSYMRHIAMDNQANPVARTAVDSREVVHSGLQFAHQSMIVGDDLTATKVDLGAAISPVLTVSDVTADVVRCDVRATDDHGFGKTVLVESSRMPMALSNYSHPDELPRLKPATVTDLIADTSIPKTNFAAGDTHIADTELNGLLVLADSATLYLDNVVVNGAIVSATALSHDPFTAFDSTTAPRVVFEGNTRIQAPDFLSGVAVVLPDGVVTHTTDELSVHVEGDIVAHTCELDRPGAQRGNIATVDPLVIADAFLRPGHGRAPQRWSDELDMSGTSETEFMAFLPRYQAPADVPAVTDYWTNAK